MKPIMLLDVDGVLNVMGKDYEDRRIALPPLLDSPEWFPVAFAPSPYTLRFMSWAWSKFRVYWLTCWGKEANRVARWAGLPPRPAFRPPPDLHGTDWKLSRLQMFCQKEPKSLFCWVEDGIAPEAHDWIRHRNTVRYVECVPQFGATEGVLDEISEWLKACGARV